MVISGLKPPEMSADRTEEDDGPPVKMVWVLKQPNDEDDKPKLQIQIQCGLPSCRRWHLFTAREGEHYRDTLFVCSDVDGGEHQEDFRGERGASWDAWCV